MKLSNSVHFHFLYCSRKKMHTAVTGRVDLSAVPPTFTQSTLSKKLSELAPETVVFPTFLLDTGLVHKRSSRQVLPVCGTVA